MSDPTIIAPEPESTPQPDVLVLPAEYFFVEQVDVPPALAASELADFAELSMEAIAPFPLEQLRWGFLTAPDGQKLLIYAALRDRLKRAGFTDLENYMWVLPDFATLHGARFEREVDVVLHGEQFDTHFVHPGGEAMPTQVSSLHKNSEAPKNRNGESVHLRVLPVELTEKGLPVFRFETVGVEAAKGHWSPLMPSEATLWQADIRPASYKGLERSTRRTTALVFRILGYAACFGLFLICLEALLFGGGFWLNQREAKIESQTTPVRRIEDKQSLMNKLEQVAQNELRPIAILRAANLILVSLGSTGIEYDETVIESGNRLTIEGKANTVNELNAFTTALNKSGNFLLVDDQSRTSSGKTSFTATLDYIHTEPTEPRAALINTPASQPEEAP